MPWAGFVLAVLWWACAAGALITLVDVNVLLAQPPITIVSGVVMALLPGLLVLMAGFMARESARGAVANALVVRAAQQLLEPTQALGSNAETLAQKLVATARDVDQSMGQALGAMKALSSEIGDERLRLESVSYAAADNARDLSSELARERSALEALIRDLRAQADTLNEAIPRQAKQMVEAARLAAEEIGRSDEALDARLSSMNEASQSLNVGLSRLSQMAGDAGAQSDGIVHAISQLEARLAHSKEMVDRAVEASETAVSAAGRTGDALRVAVSSAVDDARQASDEIHRRVRESSEVAASALYVPRGPGVGDPAETRPVHTPPRAEPQKLPDIRPAPELRRSEPQQAAPVSRPQDRGDNGLFASPPPRARAAIEEGPSLETELFEGTNQNAAPPPAEQLPPSLSHTNGGAFNTVEAPPRIETPPPPFDPIEAAPPEPNSLSSQGSGEDLSREAGWSAILNDIDRGGSGDLGREDIAETVIRKLEGAGMTLANIFRPKDKKRIAAAARKGEAQRRGVVASAAKFELERIATRLLSDEAFVATARGFVDHETPDAMAALDRTQKSNRNASPRLSAFLLLDAALNR